MPDNIEYMYLGYAAMAIIMLAMIGWIYWRYRLAAHEEQLVDQFEAEERAAGSLQAPRAVPDPGAEAPAVVANSRLPEES
jgi:hypothetical protein